MSDRGWKQFERRIARDFGTQRIPVTGERHGADARTPMFSIQCKLRRSLPSWLFDWLDGITGTAAREERIGVLVLKAPRMRDEDAIVCLRLKDFRDLHGIAITEV